MFACRPKRLFDFVNGADGRDVRVQGTWVALRARVASRTIFYDRTYYANNGADDSTVKKSYA